MSAIGVTFPQAQIEPDPEAVRAFARAAEDAGFAYIAAYDHVVGAERSGRPELPAAYDELSLFHEPLTLFAFLAAVTSSIGLATGVLVLPQRQTALVAKQAAEVAILSGGRLRVGVGTGWNWVEYEALGVDFAARGRRLDEQIELLRLLWGSSSVTFDGEFHSVSRAGICPLPDEPIPIWFGGAADVAMRRAARLGDGFTFARPDEYLKIPRIVELVKQAGRDPGSFGIEGRLVFDPSDPGGLLAQQEAWESAGATHLVLSTLQLGLRTAAAHVEAMREATELLLP